MHQAYRHLREPNLQAILHIKLHNTVFQAKRQHCVLDLQAPECAQLTGTYMCIDNKLSSQPPLCDKSAGPLCAILIGTIMCVKPTSTTVCWAYRHHCEPSLHVTLCAKPIGTNRCQAYRNHCVSSIQAPLCAKKIMP